MNTSESSCGLWDCGQTPQCSIQGTWWSGLSPPFQPHFVFLAMLHPLNLSCAQLIMVPLCPHCFWYIVSLASQVAGRHLSVLQGLSQMRPPPWLTSMTFPPHSLIYPILRWPLAPLWPLEHFIALVIYRSFSHDQTINELIIKHGYSVSFVFVPQMPNQGPGSTRHHENSWNPEGQARYITVTIGVQWMSIQRKNLTFDLTYFQWSLSVLFMWLKFIYFLYESINIS